MCVRSKRCWPHSGIWKYRNTSEPKLLVSNLSRDSAVDIEIPMGATMRGKEFTKRMSLILFRFFLRFAAYSRSIKWRERIAGDFGWWPRLLRILTSIHIHKVLYTHCKSLVKVVIFRFSDPLHLVGRQADLDICLSFSIAQAFDARWYWSPIY